MFHKKCKYAKNCQIYNGKEPYESASLMIHKNVFCIRGDKGWNNCNKYKEFQNLELP